MNLKTLLNALFAAALCGISFAQAPNGAPAIFCDVSSVENVLALGIGGGMLIAVVAALCYMAGSAIHEPRLTEYAKSQPFQIFVSFALIAVAALLVSMQCSMPFGSLSKWAGTTPVDGIVDTSTAYESAQAYLRWGATQTLISIISIRKEMGAYNIRASINDFEPQGLSSLIGLGESVSTNAGDYTLSGILGTLLNLNTMFLLSIYLQYFSMLIFTSSGVFMVLLPLGFMLRSVPFMRGVGGGIAALAVAFYLFYPMMLGTFGITMKGFYGGNDAEAIFGGLDKVKADEQGLEGDAYKYIFNDPPLMGDYSVFFRVTVYNFLRAVFFPTAGMIAIVAFTRDLSRLFGDEIDASRLVQFV